MSQMLATPARKARGAMAIPPARGRSGQPEPQTGLPGPVCGLTSRHTGGLWNQWLPHLLWASQTCVVDRVRPSVPAEAQQALPLSVGGWQEGGGGAGAERREDGRGRQAVGREGREGGQVGRKGEGNEWVEGRGGICRADGRHHQGCLCLGTPTLRPSPTVVSAPMTVEAVCWPWGRRISRWVSSDLHKGLDPVIPLSQTPHPGT